MCNYRPIVYTLALTKALSPGDGEQETPTTGSLIGLCPWKPVPKFQQSPPADPHHLTINRLLSFIPWTSRVHWDSTLWKILPQPNILDIAA